MPLPTQPAVGVRRLSAYGLRGALRRSLIDFTRNFPLPRSFSLRFATFRCTCVTAVLTRKAKQLSRSVSPPAIVPAEKTQPPTENLKFWWTFFLLFIGKSSSCPRAKSKPLSCKAVAEAERWWYLKGKTLSSAQPTWCSDSTGQFALIYFLPVRERELLDTSFAVLTHMWAVEGST